MGTTPSTVPDSDNNSNRYVCVVRLGYDRTKSLPQITGAKCALLWKNIMEPIVANKSFMGLLIDGSNDSDLALTTAETRLVDDFEKKREYSPKIYSPSKISENDSEKIDGKIYKIDMNNLR